MTLTRRAVALAGHTGDEATARRGLQSPDAAVRATALAALERLGVLTDGVIVAALDDTDAAVRRRAVTLAAGRPEVDLAPILGDGDPTVVEAAAWACGERSEVGEGDSDAYAAVGEEAIAALVGLATDRDGDALARESAVAALGAIDAAGAGDRGVEAILAATTDKPAIRRRAVLALAPYLATDHPRAAEIAAALDRAATDRDWQVRQAAETLLTAPDETR